MAIRAPDGANNDSDDNDDADDEIWFSLEQLSVVEGLLGAIPPTERQADLPLLLPTGS